MANEKTECLTHLLASFCQFWQRTNEGNQVDEFQQDDSAQITKKTKLLGFQASVNWEKLALEKNNVH